jgi:hypothetical protein
MTFVKGQLRTPLKEISASIEELAWAAGFFEGEGSTSPSFNKRKGRVDGYPRMVICQCEIQTLKKFQELFGGSITKRQIKSKNHSQSWQWSIAGEHAVQAFNAIQEYFVGTKRIEKWKDGLKKIQDATINDEIGGED